MGLVHKVRSLWRFDGDTEPILVSRRKFIFIGGVIAAASAVPWAATAFAPEEVWVAYVYSGNNGVWAITSSSEREAIFAADRRVRDEEFKYQYMNCKPHIVEMGGQRAFRVFTSDRNDPLMAPAVEYQQQRKDYLDPCRWMPPIPYKQTGDTFSRPGLFDGGALPMP